MLKLLSIILLTPILFSTLIFANCVGVVCSENFTTTTNNWEVPQGIEVITIEAWGGGGAGGSTQTGGQPQGAGGGAGGQYAISTIDVSPSQLFDITVAGVTNHPGTADTNGPTGADSSFSNITNTYTLARGGAGGQSQANGQAGGLGTSTGGIGDVVFAGGSGANGAGDSGAGGGGAGSTGAGGTAIGTTAGLGTTELGGDGGVGVLGNGDIGLLGQNYGGGGSGSKRAALGGSGAAGFVQLTYYNFSNAFRSTWDTSLGTGTNSITLPLVSSGTYDFIVFWGDGTFDEITVWNQAEVTHTYSSGGEYDVRIIGDIEGWSFNNSGDVEKIIDISQWGNLSLGNTNSHFFGANNLNISAIDAPNLSQTIFLKNSFRNSGIGLVNFSSWNTSTITDMSSLFSNATNFNGNITPWDVSLVSNMSRMFLGASIFNGSINNWNVSSVADMSNMFNNATSFNQALTSWNVRGVVNMSGMFSSATSFNQNISAWNTSNVVDMEELFSNASLFNQSLKNWDVSLVSNMDFMFQDATNFNQYITCWNVSLIPTESVDFSINSDLINSNKPLWGTNGEGCYTPKIFINSPTNGEVYNSNVELNITIGDNVESFLDTILYSINGGSNITYNGVIELDKDTDLLYGFNIIEVWANNTLGANSTNSTTFISNPSPIITDLVLHLDANSLTGISNNSALTNWSDISGNNNHAVEWGGSVTNPIFRTNTLNGKPIVRYTPANGLRIPYSSTLDLPTEFTIFALANLNSRSSGTGNIRTIISNELGYLNRNYWLVHWDDKWQTRSSPGTPTLESDDDSSLEPTILTYQATGTNFRMFVNNTLQTITQSYSSIDTQISPVGIGRQADDQRGWDGDIAEILVFSKSLNNTEISQINEYLEDKWLRNNTFDVNISLLSPTNNSKIFPQRSVNFTWSLEYNSSDVYECNIFVNSVLQGSTSCSNSSISSYEFSIPISGVYNWSVEVVDNSTGKNKVSEVFSFRSIFPNHKRVSKTLTSQGSNFYFVNSTITNFYPTIQNNVSIYELVVDDFGAGSFSPSFDTSSSITGLYEGTLHRWNFTNISSSQSVTYLISNSQNQSNVADNYIVGKS